MTANVKTTRARTFSSPPHVRRVCTSFVIYINSPAIPMAFVRQCSLIFLHAWAAERLHSGLVTCLSSPGRILDQSSGRTQVETFKVGTCHQLPLDQSCGLPLTEHQCKNMLLGENDLEQPLHFTETNANPGNSQTRRVELRGLSIVYIDFGWNIYVASCIYNNPPVFGRVAP